MTFSDAYTVGLISSVLSVQFGRFIKVQSKDMAHAKHCCAATYRGTVTSSYALTTKDVTSTGHELVQSRGIVGLGERFIATATPRLMHTGI